MKEIGITQTCLLLQYQNIVATCGSDQSLHLKCMVHKGNS